MLNTKSKAIKSPGEDPVLDVAPEYFYLNQRKEFTAVNAIIASLWLKTKVKINSLIMN